MALGERGNSAEVVATPHPPQGESVSHQLELAVAGEEGRPRPPEVAPDPARLRPNPPQMRQGPTSQGSVQVRYLWID